MHSLPALSYCSLVIMLAHLCLGLLALCSLTAASDPTCEELTAPLEDRSLLSGKWIFTLGTSDNDHFVKEYENVTSSWVEFTPGPNSDTYSIRWKDKIAGNCTSEHVTSTFTSTTAVVSQFSTPDAEHSEQYLKSCPDCLFVVDDITVKIPGGEPIKGRYLYFLTKTGTLDPAHLEVVKKQAACLNFTKGLYFTNTTDLCP
ncbi:uncharacterized protein LOC133652310 [Entelurus aequoreus]|uniref:uncharacterized protein LOC133652310 n=1 Tax=Entelurus aequoreus TaxID=161455 RepID=UPI002B1DD020|nr:uncharacterized protein LOC133652310 [Entelurus aequoreus]